jgi:thiol-disulfide isomerase/thioredoxin
MIDQASGLVVHQPPGVGAKVFCGFIASLVVLCGLGSCIKISNSYTGIPPGMWRATLILSSDTTEMADENSNAVLPFNFEVRYITEDSFIIEIINGTERIICSDIVMAFDRSIAKDTIRIGIPVFGSYITARFEQDALSGDWWDPSRGKEYHVPFRARFGMTHRFELPVQSGYENFDGTWSAQIRVNTDDPYPAVAIFDQDENLISGTFLTETGDYRYLDGNVEGDRMYLSTFDGSHAYLFETKLLDDGTLAGTYRSGVHYKTYWTAERNDTFALADPYSLTPLSDSAAQVAFQFINPEGKYVSLDDERYAGKPKIVTIFGTWCPNCRDESAFLAEYVTAHPNPGFEIISLAFERLDSTKALQAIKNYKAHFQIPWEILYGGTSNKTDVVNKLPFFESFISFPTMLFLDADNRVVKIHTGFYGPATDKYGAFVEEFEETMRRLTQNQ